MVISCGRSGNKIRNQWSSGLQTNTASSIPARFPRKYQSVSFTFLPKGLLSGKFFAQFLFSFRMILPEKEERHGRFQTSAGEFFFYLFFYYYYYFYFFFANWQLTANIKLIGGNHRPIRQTTFNPGVIHPLLSLGMLQLHLGFICHWHKGRIHSNMLCWGRDGEKDICDIVLLAESQNTRYVERFSNCEVWISWFQSWNAKVLGDVLFSSPSENGYLCRKTNSIHALLLGKAEVHFIAREHRKHLQTYYCQLCCWKSLPESRGRAAFAAKRTQRICVLLSLISPNSECKQVDLRFVPAQKHLGGGSG